MASFYGTSSYPEENGDASKKELIGVSIDHQQKGSP